MRARHLWAVMGLLAVSLSTAALLVVDDLAAGTGLVAAVSILMWTVVAIAAIVVEHSRLGYGLGVLVLAVAASVLAVASINPLWFLAAALLALTAMAWSDPTLGGWVRGRVAGAPVPTRAVCLALVLLLLPGAVSITSRSGSAWLLALAGADWIVLYAFVRRLPFAVAGVRVLPALLAVAGWFLPPPARWIWIGGQLLALALAWSRDVRLAVRPLIEKGTRVAIPPELAPEEIRQMLDGRS